MADPSNGDEFPLDIDPIDPYLKRTPAIIERQRARTANVVALSLIAGVIGSLPLHLIALWLCPDAAESTGQVFEKWYALVSPLAGAAVGAYYVSRERAA